MATELKHAIDIACNLEFETKVKLVAGIVAVRVLQESAHTPDHLTRVRWAKRMLSCEPTVVRMMCRLLSMTEGVELGSDVDVLMPRIGALVNPCAGVHNLPPAIPDNIGELIVADVPATPSFLSRLLRIN
jgi:hypothetical protein